MTKHPFEERFEQILDSGVSKDMFELGTAWEQAEVATQYRHIMDGGVPMAIIDNEQRLADLVDLLREVNAELCSGVPENEADTLYDLQEQLWNCIDNADENVDRAVMLMNEQASSESPFTGDDPIWEKGKAWALWLRDRYQTMSKREIFKWNEQVKEARKAKTLCFVHYCGCKLILELAMYQLTQHPCYLEGYNRFNALFEEHDCANRMEGKSRYVSLDDEMFDPDARMAASYSMDENSLIKIIDMRLDAERLAKRHHISTQDVVAAWLDKE